MENKEIRIVENFERIYTQKDKGNFRAEAKVENGELTWVELIFYSYEGKEQVFSIDAKEVPILKFCEFIQKVARIEEERFTL